MDGSNSRQRGSKDLWLEAAYDMLISKGIDQVKVMSLAKQLNLTRTGFYWFFNDIAELHDAMIQRWEKKNTGNLIDRCAMTADSTCAALFNLMDCWLDSTLFDAKLDLAIRNWARNDPDLERRVSDADARRINAMTALFERQGFTPQQATVRGMTVIYTQIGYFSMNVSELPQERLLRVQDYVELFAGTRPSETEIAAFLARHHRAN